LRSTAKYEQERACDSRNSSAAKKTAVYPMARKLFGIHFHVSSFTRPMAADLHINWQMLRISWGYSVE
jgi:hypothetical protein